MSVHVGIQMPKAGTAAAAGTMKDLSQAYVLYLSASDTAEMRALALSTGRCALM